MRFGASESTSPSKNKAQRNAAISGHNRGPNCATEGGAVILAAKAAPSCQLENDWAVVAQSLCVGRRDDIAFAHPTIRLVRGARRSGDLHRFSSQARGSGVTCSAGGRSGKTWEPSSKMRGAGLFLIPTAMRVRKKSSLQLGTS